MPLDDNFLHAVFRGEEMTVIFKGRPVQSDYGVPGSPTFTEIDDIEVQTLEILGHDVSFQELPNTLQASILALADDLEFDPEFQI